MYVVGKTKENGTYFARLHAINILTGEELAGSPVAIAATVPGTGNGSSGGQLSFSPLWQNNRPALNYYNGHVYVGVRRAWRQRAVAWMGVCLRCDDACTDGGHLYVAEWIWKRSVGGWRRYADRYWRHRRADVPGHRQWHIRHLSAIQCKQRVR